VKSAWRTYWPYGVIVGVIGIVNLRSGSKWWQVLLGTSIAIYIIWRLESADEKARKARNEALRWKHAYEARGEHVLNAERALVAALERSHELEVFVAAGERVKPGIWMDGEWFPVDDDVQSEG
jgi:hypothetical protein